MTQDEEIWKDIPGFEREYQVSNYGNVRSLDRYEFQRYYKKADVIILRFRHGRPMKLHKARGYFRLKLKGKKMYIHRLVALAFIPNADGLPSVDHIDRNKTNNHVSNLRWASYLLQNTNKENYSYYVNFHTGSERGKRWCFEFKSTGVYHSFLTRELAEKFRDEYFEKIGFKMLD